MFEQEHEQRCDWGRFIWKQHTKLISGYTHTQFSGGLDGRVHLQCRGPGLIPGSGRCPGGEQGNPLQYSCLENSMDGGAWQATVPGVTKSQTRLSD